MRMVLCEHHGRAPNHRKRSDLFAMAEDNNIPEQSKNLVVLVYALH
jgi:hypothetical protein